ncbi:MAG: hypothetical protein KDE14_11965 [Rhodobacteraceae bacterium]|nr:hypothetical protein [Paracoccaceae bacterium]
MTEFWIALIAKAVATALIVVAATAAAEKSGPFWGGLISCLPVSAGPAYVLLAIQHDPEFVSSAALSSLASNISTWFYLLTFATLLARRHGVPVGLAGAFGVWLVLILAIRALNLGLTAALLGSLLAFWIAIRFAPKTDFIMPSAQMAARKWFELPLRAAAVGIFVAVLVTVSDAIGPTSTGIAAVFPIALSSLGIFTHRRLGSAGAAAALVSAMRPLLGIAMALCIVYLATPQWGSAIGLTAGLAASLAWPLFLVVYRKNPAN